MTVDSPNVVHLFILDPSIKALGKGALQGCKGLRRVVAPFMERIETNALQECRDLKELDAGRVSKIGDNALLDCQELEKVKLPSVRKVNIRAFAFCGKLAEVDIGGVEQIDRLAFEGCGVLEEIRVPNATWFGDYCFLNCKKLSRVIGDGMVGFPSGPSGFFGHNCFYNCEGLFQLSKRKGFIRLSVGFNDRSAKVVEYVNWKTVSDEQKHTLLRCLMLTAEGGGMVCTGERAKTGDKVMSFLLGNGDITKHVMKFI